MSINVKWQNCMSILSKLFGNKKTYEADEQHKEQGERTVSPVLPTLMHDESASLAKYVDRKIPVLIIGGKYHQTQVVLTSNPNEKKFTASNGKAYPGVTIGMVMGTEGVKEQQNPKEPKICPPNPKTEDSPKDEKKEQQKKPFVLTFPTNIKHPTLGERYDEYCASLPPFDFYEGDNEDKIPVDADIEISDYLNRLADTLAYCRDVEKKQGFVAAEQYYLFLIGHHPWEPDAYDELLELYRNNGKNDAFEVLRLYSIDHFSKRRERMERQLTALAEQQGVKEMATEAIRKGEKVSYFRGLFTLYDPFPCIEHWKRLMPIFSDSE